MIKRTALETRAAGLSRRSIAREITGVYSDVLPGNPELAIERAEIVYNALRGSVSPVRRQLRGS